MNISQCAAQNAKGCFLEEQGRRRAGLSYIAQNAHKPPKNRPVLLFNIEKEALLEVIR